MGRFPERVAEPNAYPGVVAGCCGRVGVIPSRNPFSTRFVQPGAVPFRFPTPDGLTLLVRELESNAGWGEIVGPHGSGKSTLLASLLPALTAWQVRHVRLSTTLRRLPTESIEPSRPRSLLVIDGFEQLGYLTRRRVKRRCRQHGSGLLVTSHFSVGLPLLHRRESTPTEAMELITGLLPPGGEWVLAGFDVSRRLRHHRGNLREVLFELYDRWEQGPPS